MSNAQISTQRELPEGWFHIGDIKRYRDLVSQIPNGGSMIELGTWKGRSLCSVADLIQQKNIRVWAVDTFQGSENEEQEHNEAKTISIQDEFETNTRIFGIHPKVFAMTTNEASKQINEMFDLVFIDADHREEAIRQDIENWLPKCKGIIAGHDYELESIRKVVNEKFPSVSFTHSTQEDSRSTMWWMDVRKEKNMKKIDVIIPAYKAQNTITKTVASIAIQSISDKISVTIVNDADGIGYEKVINQFKDCLDIKEVTLEVNGGPGVARQKGIDSTSCPYFTCIDADDTFAGAFALEILLKGMESDPQYHTVIGTFIEQHENLHFIAHSNDMVWMFGKLYTRAFCEKYGVRFNDTRANEDNGFNTIIRLISSETEKVMFLPDVVYYWHHKEDSITRINNCQYSYDQSFVGYVDNMIYAVQLAKKKKPFNNYIDMWAIQIMAQLYVYYYQTITRDPRFTEQNYSYCLKYYNEVFKHYFDTMGQENITPIFAQVMAGQSANMLDFIADKTIYQFIEELGKQSNS